MARALRPCDPAACSDPPILKRNPQLVYSPPAPKDRQLVNAPWTTEGRQDRHRIEPSEEVPIRHLAVHIRWIRLAKNSIKRPTATFARMPQLPSN